MDFCFFDLGCVFNFGLRFLGIWVLGLLGLRFWKVKRKDSEKKAGLKEGFEHVKGCAGSVGAKRVLERVDCRNYNYFRICLGYVAQP